MSKLDAPDIPIDFSFGMDSLERQTSRAIEKYNNCFEASLPSDFHEFEAAVSRGHDDVIRAQQELEEGYRRHGVMGTWCASERGLFFKRFSEGETLGYQGALNNLPIVAEKIGWDEVMSFREDRESVRKYRDLRLWLSEGLGSTSEQHATDLIAQRIEDYRWAISKHGLQTITGMLGHLWDWKQSLPLVAGVGTAATLGGTAAAALLAGLSITSGIGAYFAERKISKLDTSRGPGREVAILVDIQDKFGLPEGC